MAAIINCLVLTSAKAWDPLFSVRSLSCVCLFLGKPLFTCLMNQKADSDQLKGKTGLCAATLNTIKGVNRDVFMCARVCVSVHTWSHIRHLPKDVCTEYWARHNTMPTGLDSITHTLPFVQNLPRTLGECIIEAAGQKGYLQEWRQSESGKNQIMANQCPHFEEKLKRHGGNADKWANAKRGRRGEMCGMLELKQRGEPRGREASRRAISRHAVYDSGRTGWWWRKEARRADERRGGAPGASAGAGGRVEMMN